MASDTSSSGLPSIMVPDMKPEDNYRQKTLHDMYEYDEYNLPIDSGYVCKNMRNTPQINCGLPGDSVPQSSEIGYLTGISNTDRS